MQSTSATSLQNCFLAILPADDSSPGIPPEDDIYGRLIGSWELAVAFYEPSGRVVETDAEAHFGRVLEGRAIQDVFINPRRADRGAEMPEYPGNWFGTTLRIYDPALRAWHVHWFNPRDGFRAELVGRAEGADIVQAGTLPDGTQIRWEFRDIAENAFCWLAYFLNPDGKAWTRQVEIHARRYPAETRG